MLNLRTESLFLDESTSISYPYLKKHEYPWQALAHIKEIILEIGASLPEEEYEKLDTGVWVSKKATIAPTAYIAGPTIIMEGAEIRHSAYIRGSALIGRGAVVGNSTEIKNAILFDGVQVPHFNYVGDSILGYKAHLGAGAVTSNIKSDKTNVTILAGEERIETNLRKFGAILGDFVEVGCGTVLNPGTIVGRGATIYPLSSVRGFVPAHSIYKSRGEIVEKE